MKRAAGFNLLELMITVAILAIVMTVAFSFDGNLLERNRAESFLKELQRNVAFARIKATAADEIVILCPAPPETLSPETALPAKMTGQATASVSLSIETTTAALMTTKTPCIAPWRWLMVMTN